MSDSDNEIKAYPIEMSEPPLKVLEEIANTLRDFTVRIDATTKILLDSDVDDIAEEKLLRWIQSNNAFVIATIEEIRTYVSKVKGGELP